MGKSAAHRVSEAMLRRVCDMPKGRVLLFQLDQFLLGSVGAAVIHNEQFEIKVQRPQCRCQGFDRILQGFLLIVGRHDDRKHGGEVACGGLKTQTSP